MILHWPSFLGGVLSTLGLVVGLVLLSDHVQRRHARRRERAAAARRALARAVLVRLGDRPLTGLDRHADGYLEVVLDPQGQVRPLSEAEARRVQKDRAVDEAVVSAHQRLAFHQAVRDAVAAFPRRRLTDARRALPDGLLLISLYLPGERVPGSGNAHSVWTGRIDGTEGQRAVFDTRFDDD